MQHQSTSARLQACMGRQSAVDYRDAGYAQASPPPPPPGGGSLGSFINSLDFATASAGELEHRLQKVMDHVSGSEPPSGDPLSNKLEEQLPGVVGEIEARFRQLGAILLRINHEITRLERVVG